MCPDENTIASYLQGTLAAADVQAVESHVDTCGTCQEMLNELGRLLGAVAERPPSAPPPAVQRIGRYVVEATIGHGGMGEVLLASDPVLHRRVALKLIKKHAFRESDEPEAMERLVREARAMATLAHPHVVTIYDAGEHEGQVFLAMEFVEGTTLAFWLATGAPSWSSIVDRFVEAGRGLAAAHDAGILHRDFKPQNVLIGADGRTRVTDFGLARSLHAPPPAPTHATVPSGTDTSPSTQLTVAGSMMGTPAYMSPEQLHGQPVDARSDVFSFSVACYEALFGVRPYDAPTVEGMRWQMAEGRPHQGPNLRGVPSDLTRVLMRGFAVSPRERPASMHVLLSELEQARGSESHVRTHVLCQAVFAVSHVIVAGLFFYSAFGQPGAPSPSSALPSSSSEDLGVGMGVAAAFIIVWAFSGLLFLCTGPFWAALNAFGLSQKRSWARRSTILYGAMAFSSCIGIPYGVYAIWSLTRPAAKRTLCR